MVSIRLASLLAVTALGLGAVGFALADSHPPVHRDDTTLAVRAITAGGDSATPIGQRYAATLHFEREADLSFRVPGRITRLALRAGDRAAPGTLLAAIEPDAFAAAATRAAADVARTQRDADRLAALVGDGATSPAAAAAAGDAARAARAAAGAAQYDLASTRLLIPWRALVLDRRAQAGETVGAGQVVARIADLGSPQLALAQVPAERAATLHRGDAAQVWTSDGALGAPGHVTRIAGATDPQSGLVTVEIRLARPLTLASGSPLAVAFAAQAPAADARQRIPAEALIDADDTSASVWTIAGDGRAHRARVRFFGFDDRDALVAGLPAGARVITAGAGFVGEGQRVRVIGA